MSPLAADIQAVKVAKAINKLPEVIRIYGSLSQAIRAFDCIDRDELIKTLAMSQTVSVFKCDGRIIIQ